MNFVSYLLLFLSLGSKCKKRIETTERISIKINSWIIELKLDDQLNEALTGLTSEKIAYVKKKIVLSFDENAKATSKLYFKSNEKNTKFKRTNNISEEVARKYTIMRRLQLNFENLSNKSFVFTPGQLNGINNVITNVCTHLTSKFKSTQSSCLQSPCNTSTSYRSIDGCCNNILQPYLGDIHTWHN